MSNFLKPYNRLKMLPLGKWLFSKGVGLRAPYFSSIRPSVQEYRAGHAEVRIADRRRVHNHIGTVHAIALCNLAELCAGLTIDSLMPEHLRWIPQGMTVRYVKKAQGTITGKCSLEPDDIQEGAVIVPVSAFNPQGELVFEARIDFYVSRKKPS